MNRRRARAATTAALALILAGCGILEPDSWAERQATLDRSRALWESAAIESYQYRLERWCYCGLFGELRVTVVDGVVTAAERPDGQPIDEAGFQYLETVEYLFDRTQQAIDDRAYRFQVEYHPELGYPTLLDLDPDRNAIDEEIRYEVGDLTRLE